MFLLHFLRRLLTTLGDTLLPQLICKLSREMVSAFLPADQGYALMKASAAVMELHGECTQKKRRGSVNNLASSLNIPVEQPSSSLINGDMLNQAILADPTGTIFSVPERQLIPPRLYHEDGLSNGLLRESIARDRNSSLSLPGEVSNFFGEKSATKYSELDLRKIVVAAYADGNNPRVGAFEGFCGLSSPVTFVSRYSTVKGTHS